MLFLFHNLIIDNISYKLLTKKKQMTYNIKKHHTIYKNKMMLYLLFVYNHVEIVPTFTNPDFSYSFFAITLLESTLI